MNYILLIVIGYLAGMINPATIIAKMKNTDIRQVGSKNPGASNVTMTFGWKYGIITGLIDIFKALIPVAIFNLLGYTDFELIILGTAAIAGHVYPVYMKFQGGKGTASFIGVMFGLHPLLGLITGLILVITTIITDFIALGTILMMLVWLAISFFYYGTPFFYIAMLVPIMSIYKHYPNVIKILKKEESGLRATFKKEPTE